MRRAFFFNSVGSALRLVLLGALLAAILLASGGILVAVHVLLVLLTLLLTGLLARLRLVLVLLLLAALLALVVLIIRHRSLRPFNRLFPAAFYEQKASAIVPDETRSSRGFLVPLRTLRKTRGRLFRGCIIAPMGTSGLGSLNKNKTRGLGNQQCQNSVR